MIDSAQRQAAADAGRRLTAVAQGMPYEGTFALTAMRQDIKAVLTVLEDSLGMGIFGPDPEVKP